MFHGRNRGEEGMVALTVTSRLPRRHGDGRPERKASSPSDVSTSFPCWEREREEIKVAKFYGPKKPTDKFLN